MSSHAWTTGLLTLLLLCGHVMASGAVARADERSAAQLTESGQAHFDAGRYEVALTEFQAAYDLNEDPALLYQLYRCNNRLERIPQALSALTVYVESLSKGPERAKLEARMHELRQMQAGPQFGEEISVLPQPGASLDGPASSSWAPRQAAAPVERFDRKGMRIALGVGGAAGVIAVVTGAWAAGTHGKLESDCGSSPEGCTDAELSLSRKLAITSDVTLAMAATGLVTGLILWAKGRHRELRSEQERQLQLGLVSGWVGRHGAGLSHRRSF